jgi:lectin, mannose-binding 1
VLVNEELCFQTNALDIGPNYFFGISAAQSADSSDSHSLYSAKISHPHIEEEKPVEQVLEELNLQQQDSAGTVQTEGLGNPSEEHEKALKDSIFNNEQIYHQMLDISKKLSAFNDFKYALERVEQQAALMIAKVHGLEEKVAVLTNGIPTPQDGQQGQPPGTISATHRLTEEILRFSLRLDNMDKALSEHTSSVIEGISKSGYTHTGVIIIVSVQLALAGSYFYYKRRRANMPKKFI